MKAGKLLVRFVLLALVIVALVGFVPAQQSGGELPVLEIGGIGLAAVIVALVELLKLAGLPAKYAPWANGVLSLIGYGLMVTVQVLPQTESYVVYGLNALMIFLAAAGVYDRTQGGLSKLVGKKTIG